jgi:hypothetical protein
VREEKRIGWRGFEFGAGYQAGLTLASGMLYELASLGEQPSLRRKPDCFGPSDTRATAGHDCDFTRQPILRGHSEVDPIIATANRSIFHALRALALRGAGLRPLVLVFEDMHWADSSTQGYLDFFMDSVAGARLMLILTYRLGYTPSFGTKSFHSTVNLRHLTNEQTLEMGARFLGSELFPEELRSALMQKAEGVPLFVEEVTKTLLDLGTPTRVTLKIETTLDRGPRRSG